MSLCEASVEILAGELPVAELALRHARSELRATPPAAEERPVAAKHALVLALLDRRDEALAAASFAASSGTDDVGVRNEWLRAEALARAPDDPTLALALVRDARELLEGTDFLPLQAETLLDAARVERLAGLVEDAGRSVAQARALFERQGHLVGIEHAKAASAAL